MLMGCILKLPVAGRDQFQFDLNGRVSQYAGKLCLRLDLRRHQIHDQNAQSTDILRHGAGLRHEEDILPFQDLCCR